MAGIGESLTHKLGPLPVWAWGGLAVVGVLVFGKRAGGGAPGAAAGQSQYPGGSLPQTVASAPVGNDPISQQYLQHIDQALNDMLAQHQNDTQGTAQGQRGGGWLPSATPSAGLSAALQEVIRVISDPNAPAGNPRSTIYNRSAAENLAGNLAATGLDDNTLANLGNYIISNNYILTPRDLARINQLKAQGFSGDTLVKQIESGLASSAYDRLHPRNAVPYIANQGWYNGFGYGTAGMAGVQN